MNMINKRNDPDGFLPLNRMIYSRDHGKRQPIQIRLTMDVAKRLEQERQRLGREIGGVPSIALTVETVLRRAFGMPT